MPKSKSEVFDSLLAYHLSKLLPEGRVMNMKLRNGLTYKIRSRTVDRAVIKEVWMYDMYDKHGVKVEKGDTVIDVGGHIGVFSVCAAELSQTGKVFAFEPFPANFKLLEENKAINHKGNLTAYNLGVTGKPGTATMYLAQDHNTGGHSLYLNKGSSEKIEVKTISLGQFCIENNIINIDFLKLDCEGAEYDILEDETILKKTRKIIMECHPYGENTIASMVSLLERNTFKVVTEMIGDSGLAMIYAKKD